MGRLGGIETVLLDLDGTLYVGSQVVPGATEAVRWLRDQGLTVRFTTNTDSITPAALAERLARLGFQAAEDELVTPIAVASRLFTSADDARVLAVAADGVRRLLAGRLAGPGDRVTHALVAESQLRATDDELDAAFRAVRAGAELVATRSTGSPRPRRRRASRHGRVGATTGVRHRRAGPVPGQAVTGVLHRPPGRTRPRTGDRAGRRRRPGGRHRRRADDRRDHGADPRMQGRPPQPSRAPRPSPMRRRQHRRPTRDCSKAERTRPQS